MARQATLDLANKLPGIIHAAVAIVGQYPNLSMKDFKKHLAETMGYLPDNLNFPISTLEDLYRRVFRTDHIGLDGRRALSFIQRALAPEEDEEARAAAPGPQGVLPPVAPTRQGPPPAEVEVICNGNPGTFVVKTQAICCKCDSCKSIAKEHGLPRLELSPTEFEKHSGMGNSKKWKYTVRLSGPGGTTIGQWMDEYGMVIKYTKSTKHDALVRDTWAKPEYNPANQPPDGAPPEAAAGPSDSQYNYNHNYNRQQPMARQNSPSPAAAVALAAAIQQVDGTPTGQLLPASGRVHDRRKAKPPAPLPTRPQELASHRNQATGRPSAWTDPRTGAPAQQPLSARPTNTAAPGPPHAAKPWQAPRPSSKDDYSPDAPSFWDATATVRATNGNYLTKVPGFKVSGAAPKLQSQSKFTEDRVSAFQPPTGPYAEDPMEDFWKRGAPGTAGPVRPLTAEPSGAGGGSTNGSEGDGKDGDGAEGGATGRSQRQRKQPSWMKQTVDPNAVLSNRTGLTVPRTALYEEEEEQGVKRKRGRQPGSGKQRSTFDLDALLGVEIDTALAKGRRPEINGWRITDSNQLAVTIHLGGVTFTGVLPALPIRSPTSPAVTAALMREQHMQNQFAMQHDASGLESDSERYGEGLPPPPASAMRAVHTALKDEIQIEGNAAFMDQRRAAAALEYERLLVSGPPEDAKCVLCHGGDTDMAPIRDRGPGGKASAGLGGLMLIRTSAVQNAWVHDQCARWSPEVHDPA